MVISAVFAATASPSRWCAVIDAFGSSLSSAASTSGRPDDRAGLARDHDGARARAFRNGRDRGDVAGAAEVLGERARDCGVDLERRQEGVGAEQGGHAGDKLVRRDVAGGAGNRARFIQRDERAPRLRVGLGKSERKCPPRLSSRLQRSAP